MNEAIGDGVELSNVTNDLEALFAISSKTTKHSDWIEILENVSIKPIIR